MSLSHRLVQQVPRETSGSTSANRFDYQLDWALCRLLELHEVGEDYVLVLDYHDDVLVLESASDPQSVLCYQVKSRKNGNWTTARLIKRATGKEGPLPSILGKLFQHTIDFGDAVIGLHFISNASLSSKGRNGDSIKDKQSIAFGDLSDEEREKVCVALREECTGGKEADLEKFTYERTPLVIEGHSTQATGLLAEFLETIPEAGNVRVPAFYRALRDELGRAARYESRPATFDQLCAVKATTRQRFQSMLADACAEPRRVDHAAEIASRLDMEHVDFRIVQSVRQATRRLMIERLNPGNPELDEAILKVESAVRTVTTDGSLWTAIESVRKSANLSQLETRFGLPYLRAMIGVALYEASQLPGIDTGSQEKEA